MIPPPAPACRRQARMPMDKRGDLVLVYASSFVAAVWGGKGMNRREAQVVG